MECACCGVSYLEFLGIDHILGGGNQQRKKLFSHGGGGSKFYRWLMSNNFPPGFRVLCNNCNNSLGNFGYCPHQTGGMSLKFEVTLEKWRNDKENGTAFEYNGKLLQDEREQASVHSHQEGTGETG